MAQSKAAFQTGDVVACDSKATDEDKVEGFTFTISALGRPPRVGGCMVGLYGTPCFVRHHWRVPHALHVLEHVCA